MNFWNPSLYLTFDRERTQPAIDLAARVEIEAGSDQFDKRRRASRPVLGRNVQSAILFDARLRR